MSRVTITAMAALYLLLPQPAQAAQKLIKLEGMVYLKARPIILGYGWKPLQGGCQGAASDRACARFPEIGNCSGTGLGYCDMTFIKRGRCLVLVTVGGAPNVELGGEAIIRDVMFRHAPCPKDPNEGKN